MQRKTKCGFFFPAFFLLTAILSLCGCHSGSQPIRKTGYYFDTVITLTGYGSGAEDALSAGLDLCAHYESLFSRTIEGSDVWRINHAGGQPVEVDPDTAYLLTAAVEYAELTDGLIDPTVTPLSVLWNFTGDPPGPVPSQEQIDRALSHVDYHAIRIDGTTVTLTDAKASLDLGFIAKGYIADRLKELFCERGLSHALINLGGNVEAVGTKPDGSAFTVGIQLPFGKRGETAAVVSLNDQSLVSSGSYERYFKENGVLYHHILDPSTGYPADSDLSGVTILSGSSLQGDALSTSCFLLGRQKGQALIESLPGIEALFITKDGSIYKTGGFPD